MLKGKMVVERIDTEAANAEVALTAAKDEVAGKQAQVLQLADRRAQTYVALSSVLLDTDELAQTPVTGTLVPALQRWSGELDATVSAARIEVEKASEQVASAQNHLDRCRAESEAAGDALEGLEADLAKALSDDASYSAALAAYQSAHGEYEHASERLKSISRTAEEKAQTYLDGPLFRYLWDRRFRKPTYRGWGLTKRLDGWVADLCGYAIALRNYELIRALPEWYEEHVTGLEVKQNATSETLRSELVRAREAIGWTPVAERYQDAVEREKVASGRLAELNEQQVRAEQEFGEHARAESSQVTAVLAECTAWLESHSLKTLRDLAARTPGDEDDVLVEELAELETRYTACGRELDEARVRERNCEERFVRAKRLQVHAEREHYGSSRSRFRADLDIDTLMAGYIVGQLASDDVFRSLGDSHSERPSPSDVGSPDSDFFSGGGIVGGSFSGGGGFGGSDFSTGGDF